MRPAHRSIRRFGTYAAAVAVFVLIAFPLYGVMLTSVQREADIRSRDVNFVPRYIDASHYREVLSVGHIVPIREAMVNSFIISTLSALIAVAIAVPATYALGRMQVPAKKYILAALVSIYLLPTLLFVIPLYIKAVELGLVDTYPGLIIPYVAFLLPFLVWILGGFLKAVPIEVEEAARLDGATRLQLMTKIVLPLMQPGILAALLMGFILSWIEFLTPLLFTGRLKVLTVSLGLYRSTFDIQIGQLAAAAVVTALPVIVLTVVFQRNIREAVAAGADR